MIGAGLLRPKRRESGGANPNPKRIKWIESNEMRQAINCWKAPLREGDGKAILCGLNGGIKELHSRTAASLEAGSDRANRNTNPRWCSRLGIRPIVALLDTRYESPPTTLGTLLTTAVKLDHTDGDEQIKLERNDVAAAQGNVFIYFFSWIFLDDGFHVLTILERSSIQIGSGAMT